MNPTQIQPNTDDEAVVATLFGDADERTALEALAYAQADEETPAAWPTVTLLTRTIVIGC